MERLIVQIIHGNLWYEDLEGVTFDVLRPNRHSYIVASDWDNYDGTYRIIRMHDCKIVQSHTLKNEWVVIRRRVTELEAEIDELKEELREYKMLNRERYR